MFRIGFGNDIHRLESGRPLILGGVEIPSVKGAVGHSDADALSHAITDAIFGALAVGDIGLHFPDNDDRWKGASSLVFLAEALRLAREKRFAISNIDSTINLEAPKLRPFIDQMRQKLSKVLEIDPSQINIKAKTGEKMDSVGEGKAVKAEAVVLLVATAVDSKRKRST